MYNKRIVSLVHFYADMRWGEEQVVKGCYVGSTTSNFKVVLFSTK
jgi:hypothetical protein